MEVASAKLLKRLARRGAVLVAATDAEGGYVLAQRADDGAIPQPAPRHQRRQSAAAVEVARQHGLIEPALPGVWRLSRKGRAAIRLHETTMPGAGGAERPAKTELPSGAWNVDGAIAWLSTRRGPRGEPLVSDADCRAGARFRADMLAAGRSLSTTIDWMRAGDGAGTGGGHADAVAHLVDSAVAARQRVEAALAALGPQLGPVAVDACCAELGVTEIERRHGFPPRSGKLMIACALDQLTRHYGLSNARPSPASQLSRPWA